MFELIGEKSRRSPHGDTLPIAISTAAHLLVLSMLIIVPLLFVAERLPEIPAITAFVAPTPPPPPAPARTPAAARPVPTTGAFAAPLEAPARVEPEAGIDHGEPGVPGGVEGGVPGGVLVAVLGGIIGGLPSDIPPPLMLNGKPERFVLTVIVSFRLSDRTEDE